MSRRLTRRAVAASVAVAALLGVGLPSQVWASSGPGGSGDVSAEDGTPGGQSGSSDQPPPSPSPSPSPATTPSAAPAGAPTEPQGLSAAAAQAAACGAVPGSCQPPATATPVNAPPAGPSEDVLGVKARADLHISISEPNFSAAAQIVNIPTWMWFPAGAWQPQVATAASGLVIVTVSATPISSRWDMGDGTVVVCSGPGTPFDHWPAGVDPTTIASPDCGHTYRRWSGDEPEGLFHLSVQVRYRVAWTSSTGRGGAQPDLILERDDTTARVLEVQALNGS